MWSGGDGCCDGGGGCWSKSYCSSSPSSHNLHSHQSSDGVPVHLSRIQFHHHSPVCLLWLVKLCFSVTGRLSMVTEVQSHPHGEVDCSGWTSQCLSVSGSLFFFSSLYLLIWTRGGFGIIISPHCSCLRWICAIRTC